MNRIDQLIGAMLCWGTLLFAGCIDPYEPELDEEQTQFLVVDGTICGDDQTTIRLSQSIGVNDSSLYEAVGDAEVYVIRDDGQRSEMGQYMGDGRYRLTMESLDPAFRYGLLICWEGREYQSSLLTPCLTPEIDTLYWEAAEGEPVRILLDTHGGEEQSPYYRWSFEEDYEIQAKLWASFRYDPDLDSVLYIEPGSPLNHFYCWVNRHSTQLLIESTTQLSSNRVSRKELTRIPLSDERLCELYRIRVRQYAIGHDSYVYHENLRKNVELGGGLFAPQLSEMRGNLTCVTDPSIPVLGYVDVATVTEAELYIWSEEVNYQPVKEECEVVRDAPIYDNGIAASLYQSGWGLVLYSLAPPSYLTRAPLTCVDCTFRGGNKNRPADWPTNHY